MKLKKYNSFVLVISFIFIISVLAGCVGSEENGNADNGETIEFSLGHVTQESHIWHKTAEKLAEELDERSEGRMSLDIYPDSQLGEEEDMFHEMENGSMDFGFMTNAYTSTRSEEFNAWFMPFIFDDLEEAISAKDLDASQEMLDGLESQGFIGMDFLFAGNRHVLMDDTKVEKPDDVKDKKIRSIGSPSIQDFWEETGASPEAMPLTEVYTSLETGVIDGIDIDLDALTTEKYYEIADDLTLTNHMTWPAVAMMSEESYSNLSSEDQEIVEESMDAAIEWGNNLAIEREDSNIEDLEEENLNIEDMEDTSSFDSVTEKIHEKYSEKSDIIDSFLEEVQD